MHSPIILQLLSNNKDKTLKRSQIIKERQLKCLFLIIVKEELRPEIFLLHMKVLTLIKAKSNVFL